MTEGNTHKGKFMGKIQKKRYSLSEWRGDVKIYDYYECDWKIISECEFNKPPLKRHENVHLHELDEIVLIEGVIRSTDNSYVYHTNYVIDTIEDEETNKSKEKAEERLKDMIEKSKEQDMEEDVQLMPMNNKKWYQFWK